ncbi:unnamed protein product, partial [Didymodactylos carnosus]
SKCALDNKYSCSVGYLFEAIATFGAILVWIPQLYSLFKFKRYKGLSSLWCLFQYISVLYIMGIITEVGDVSVIHLIQIILAVEFCALYVGESWISVTKSIRSRCWNHLFCLVGSIIYIILEVHKTKYRYYFVAVSLYSYLLTPLPQIIKNCQQPEQAITSLSPYTFVFYHVFIFFRIFSLHFFTKSHSLLIIYYLVQHTGFVVISCQLLYYVTKYENKLNRPIDASIVESESEQEDDTVTVIYDNDGRDLITNPEARPYQLLSKTRRNFSTQYKVTTVRKMTRFMMLIHVIILYVSHASLVGVRLYHENQKKMNHLAYLFILYIVYVVILLFMSTMIKKMRPQQQQQKNIIST